MYTLKNTITIRANNEDEIIHELDVPAIVTVGMMRKVTSKISFQYAHQFTRACANLGAQAANQLSAADALGYAESIIQKITPLETSSVVIPDIKPYAFLINKITVDLDQEIELACQVLIHSGYNAEKLNAMDIRDFVPAVPDILQAFIDPKS